MVHIVRLIVAVVAIAAIAFPPTTEAAPQQPATPIWLGAAQKQAPVKPKQLVVSTKRPGTFPLVQFTGLRWSSWGGAEASADGYATYRTQSRGGSAVPVRVTMGGVTACYGRAVYTSVTAAATGPLPTDWVFDLAARGISKPCWIDARGCPVNKHRCSIPRWTGWLRVRGSNTHRGRMPFGGTAFLAEVTGWGTKRAEATAVINRTSAIGATGCASANDAGACDNFAYPVRYRFSRPIFCSDGFRYSRMTAELFGQGLRFAGGPNPSGYRKVRARLMRDLKRPQVRRLTVTARQTTASCGGPRS